VLSKILKQLSGKDPLTIYNLKPIRDFIFIDDVVDAIVSLVLKDTSGIYNIGSGVETSINNLIEIVLNASEQYDREIKSTIKNIDYSYNALNVEQIKNTTSWEPKFTLSQSVKKMLNSKEYVK